jgi:hypothetical protein
MEGTAVETVASDVVTTVAAVAAAVPAVPDRAVEVLDTTMWIHELSIERASIVAYLQKISPEKQEIALIHLLEVGVTELLARRERFQH